MLAVLLVTLSAAPPPASKPELQALREGPIDFRCDYGQAYNKPSRFECRDNVLVRRGDLLMCCKNFEGYRTEQGEWQRFVCEGDVRAQRGDELMWADRATFIVGLGDLILEGRPLLVRGQNALEGERIVVDTKYDQARVEKPRGRLAENAPVLDPKAVGAVDAPLPERCPIGAAPRKGSTGKP